MNRLKKGGAVRRRGREEGEEEGWVGKKKEKENFNLKFKTSEFPSWRAVVNESE